MFSFSSYQSMINELAYEQYIFTNYNKKTNNKKTVILRHDVDFDLEKAIKFARFETKLGISSVYFILVTSNFYNIFSQSSKEILQEILNMGHDIGLHFDETQYIIKGSKQKFERAVRAELNLLEKVINKKITVVSMHRPSQFALHTVFDFGDGVINSYSEEFFCNFKYISDSHMIWREDVFSIIKSNNYDHLHILTHPIWYNEFEKAQKEIIQDFFEKREKESITEFSKNFTNFYNIFEEKIK